MQKGLLAVKERDREWLGRDCALVVREWECCGQLTSILVRNREPYAFLWESLRLLYGADDEMDKQV